MRRETFRPAAQVPKRGIHGGETHNADARMAEEANVRPGSLVKRGRHRRIEIDQERLKRTDHVAQNFQALAVDGEAQTLARDTLVGIDEYQNRVGRADLEACRQDRTWQRKARDFST